VGAVVLRQACFRHIFVAESSSVVFAMTAVQERRFPRHLANSVGFDDAPFSRTQRERVAVVGAVFARTRFDGVLIGSVERDGDDATEELVRLLRSSRFDGHVQVVLLQGITFAGFNVVDVAQLASRLRRPVMVVARKRPDWERIRRVLHEHIPGGAQKWARIEALGPMEPLGSLFVQRCGLSREEAAWIVDSLALHGKLPEPLRVAHLIAGAIGRGASHGRA